MNNFDYSRVLTTGSNGMVGSYIDFGIRTNTKTLNVLDGDAVMAFCKLNKPGTIIHLASATDTTRCETDPSYAYQLNSVGTLNVALAAQEIGAQLVYVSTSRVFSGVKKTPYAENDRPDPATVYGKSKYLGEVIASTIAPECLIVRGCWMFGGGPLRDNKFYGNIMKQLKNEEIAALDDVCGSPTYVKDFIQGIKLLIAEGKQGIVHLSNAGVATRAEIVEHILRSTKSSAHLKRVNQEYFKSKYALPANESISSTQLQLRPWQDALTEYLEEEWKIVS